ncbi:MAG: hypothetical protein IJH12_06640 [Clostridia bacterium]|nr:hypothetical protein [Clostridia bacterium]
MEITFTILSLIFVLIGVVFIYDARKITKSRFSFQDINEGTKYLKILGFIFTILGLCIMYYYAPSTIDILKNMK